MINRLKWWEFRGWYAFPAQVAFQLKNDADVYYLGTLLVETTIERTPLSVKLKDAKISVVDEYEDAQYILQTKHPVLSGKMQKTLMIHDERIPKYIEEVERKDTILGILNALSFGLMTIP